jgi:PAS domain S-box-containing protein
MNKKLNITNEMYAFMDTVYNPVLAIDMDGVIVFCNKAMESVTGFSRRSIEGCHISDVVQFSELHRILKTGKTESARKVVINEKVFISNRSPVKIDGEIVGAIAVLQDISDLELISSELEHTKMLTEELQAIIESSFDGIYVTDGNARTIRVNNAYERITGLKRDEVIGKTMEELIDKGYYNDSVTLRVLETGKPETLIQKIKTGKTVMVTGTPILSKKGDIRLVVTNVRDVTELHRLQTELEKMENLQTRYITELTELKGRIEGSENYILRSKKMKEVHELALRLARVDSTVVIQGESGAGKEVIANVIHENSRRKDKPFLKISCAAIPDNLLESELFGYSPGAFTGANKNGKPGLFEMADKGTVLLDEIGELPLTLQAKLLRVIQEKECMRVGSSVSTPVDVRIIAATNRNLKDMVKNKEFRKDLFFRLNVVPVFVPPLRERKECLVFFVKYFLERYNKKYGFSKIMDPSLIDIFYDYDWPGNVRELENIIERMVVVSTGDVLDKNCLPSGFMEHKKISPGTDFGSRSFRELIEEYEKKIIEVSIRKEKSTRKAAAALGLNQSTVVRKMKKYDISPLSDDLDAQ